MSGRRFGFDGANVSSGSKPTGLSRCVTKMSALPARADRGSRWAWLSMVIIAVWGCVRFGRRLDVYKPPCLIRFTGELRREFLSGQPKLSILTTEHDCRRQ